MSLLSSKKAPSDCKAQCPDCGVTLSRLADMNRHRRTKHPDGNETKFPCPWIGCGYEATQRGNLKSHIDARHSDGPKYPCPECGRGFTDAAARIRHRKKLHGYVPYHTKEYLARQALKRKERVVQETSKVDSNKSRRQQVARAVPDLPDASSSVPPPAPELPEVAYHDQSWKMPVDITHSYPPQAPPSQGGPLFLPFETWPGYGAPNAIQHFPSAAQSQPSLTPSNFTVDYYSDLHNVPIPSMTYGPQLRTMQPQQQEFGESFTGDLFNGNGPWNWPLQ
ncbi:hypothetical protein F5888DRAFT_1648729 [Russula emetica]|nr:hypothetical protein F5888DRAFT_1648729 [Russula emetica]